MLRTISAKFRAIIFVNVLILLFCGAFVFKMSYDIKEKYLIELSEMTLLLTKSKDLNTQIIQIQQWLTDISATRAATGFDDGYKNAQEFYNLAQLNVDELAKFKDIDPESIKLLKRNLENFYNTGKKMAAIYITEGPVAGNKFMASFDEASEDLQKLLGPILLKIKDVYTQSFSKIDEIIVRLEIFILVSFIVLIIFVTASLFYVGRSIVKTLRQKNKILNENVENLLLKAKELESNASELNQVVSTQASALQETVTAVDEISSMVQRNADSASNSANVSLRSNSAAGVGKDKVESMIFSISEITKSNEDIMNEITNSNAEISKLVEMISEIGEKTKVINDIVFQLKLLSFNASVEAARAGEQGKGFSVVAEEVGNLAAMSGKASLEITKMLDDSTDRVTTIVNKTKVNVESLVKVAKQKVEQGTLTANDCSVSLNEIQTNVASVSDLVNEIAQASGEQALGIQEVTKAMQELDSSTHQNTTIASNNAQMSLEIKDQAMNIEITLKELMAIV